jgi:hypothetical protein
MHDVFLSHSSQDKALADELCAALESRKLRCWLAPRDIAPGAEYGAAILDAIETSAVVVLILSAHSNASPQVLREVERAVSNGITVLPLRTETVAWSKSLEYFLSATQWVDAFTAPRDAAYRRLGTAAQARVAEIRRSRQEVRTVPKRLESPMTEPRLIVVSVQSGEEPAQELSFNGVADRRVMIGRNRSCEIMIDDLHASHKHAMLFLEPDGWHVQDLGSMNGTFRNDEPVVSEALAKGDVLEIGDTRITVLSLGG